MRLLALAWRNLLRNRRRSLATLSAMVLGMMTVLLFGGYVRDIAYAMQADFVSRTGHLQVQHRDYFKLGTGNPAAYGVAGYEQLLGAIRGDAELASLMTVATPMLQFGAIAGNFDRGVSHPVFVTGVVIDDQNRMMDWNEYGQLVLSRPQSLTGTSPDSAVIGTGVARILHLCGALEVPQCEDPPVAGRSADMPAPGGAAAKGASKGDLALPDDIAGLAETAAPASAAAVTPAAARIELLATASRGAPNVAALAVRRAEFQGVKELDDVYVAVHLAQAQALVFGRGPRRVTAIAVQLKHTGDLERARQRLEDLLARTTPGQPLTVIDYETLNPFYGQTLAMFAAIFGFIAVLIGAIVLFTVSNTMSMAVVERTAEIGTIRAMGERQAGVKGLFLIEGLMLGLAGALCGLVGAWVVAELINLLGLTWTPPGRVEPVPLAVRLAGEHAMMAATAAGIVAVAALSAWWPARRAARMNIVDALRHV